MPTIRELESALISADKAGDKSAAIALAADIDNLLKTVGTNEQDIPSQQQEIVDRMSGELGGIGERGVEEGGISLGEAIMSAPFRAALGEKFVSIGRGVKQIFSSDEESEAIAKTAAEEKALVNKRLEQNPRESAAFNLGRGTATLGETAALTRYIPSPSAIGLGGGGLVKSIGRIGYTGAVSGGVAATTPTQPGETKGEQVALPALVGLGLGAAVEGIAAGARPLASKFSTKKDVSASGGLLKENPAFERGQILQKETGTRLTPGQLTGSPGLSEMRPPQEFVNAQTKETLRFFKSVRDTVSKQAKPSPELAIKLDDATQDIYKQLAETRRKVGDFRYGQFKGSVKEVYIDDLRKTMDKIADDAIHGTDEAKILLMRNKLVSQLDETGGSLTTEQVLGWKKRIDGLLEGKSDIFKDLAVANQKRLGRQLMDSLYEDLGNTGRILELQGNKAPAELLKRAVSDYRKFSAPLKELEESALGAIFKKDKFTPEEAARKLMSLDPSEVRGIYSILENHNPNLIREYQATKLYDSMKSTIRTGSETAGRLAGETKIVPKKAIEELTKKNGLRAIFDRDPILMKKVNQGVALLDRIADRTISSGKQGAASRESEVARNVVSGNPIFISGTAAKYLGPVGLWKLTTSQGGIDALKVVATAPLNSARYNAALQSVIKNLDELPEE